MTLSLFDSIPRSLSAPPGSHRSDPKVLQAYNTSLLKSNSAFRDELAAAQVQAKALKLVIAGLVAAGLALHFRK